MSYEKTSQKYSERKGWKSDKALPRASYNVAQSHNYVLQEGHISVFFMITDFL